MPWRKAALSWGDWLKDERKECVFWTESKLSDRHRILSFWRHSWGAPTFAVLHRSWGTHGSSEGEKRVFYPLRDAPWELSGPGPNTSPEESDGNFYKQTKGWAPNFPTHWDLLFLTFTWKISNIWVRKYPFQEENISHKATREHLNYPLNFEILPTSWQDNSDGK